MELGSAHGQISFLYDPGGIARAKSDLESLGQAGDNMGQKLIKSGGALLGFGGAVSAGVGLATGVAANFEQQLANIASVGGKEAVDRMSEISDVALQLGKDTSFSASEAAAGMEEMIKAGVPLSDVLNGGAQAALNLSAATGTPVVESAELMSTALTVFSDTMTEFSTEADKATHVADLFTQAANASATDVHDLGFAFQQTALVADMFGVSVDDLATGLAIMADNGLRGSDAGTSLKSMLLSLTRQTKPAQEALAEIGLTFDDFVDSAGQFVGIEPMFDTLRKAMTDSGKSASEVNDILAQLFGPDGIRAASVFFDTNEEGWNRMRDDMEKVGTASEQAEIRMDTFLGSAEKLKGSIETALIAFGTPLLGGMRKTTEGITELVNKFIELDPAIQGVIAKAVALTGTLAGIGGSALIAAGYFVKLAQAMGVSQNAALRMVGAFGVLGALLAIATGAYVTNFLGFRDAVNALTGEIVSFGKTVADTFAKKKAAGLNNFAAGLAAIGEGLFWTENPALMELGKIFDTAAIGAQAFGDSMAIASAQGAGPLLGLVFSLGNAFEAMGMQDVADRFYDAEVALAHFGNTFENVFEAAKAGGKDSVAAAIEATGAAIERVTGLDVSPFFDDLSDRVQRMTDVFNNAISTGLDPFQAALETVKAAFEGLLGVGIDNITDVVGDFAGSLRTVADELIAGNFEDAFNTLGTAVRDLGDAIGPQIQTALTNLGNTIGAIDISQVVFNVLDWAQGKIADLGAWIRENVLTKIPPVDLGQIVANISSWLVEQKENLATVINTTVERAKTAIGAAGAVLGQMKATIESWLVEQKKTLGVTVNEKIEEAKKALGSTGFDLGTLKATVGNWIVEQQNNLSTIINETVQRAKTAIGAAGSSLGTMKATIQGWLVDGGDKLGPALNLAATTAKNAIGAAGATLGTVAATVTDWLITDGGDILGKIGTKAGEIIAAAAAIDLPQVAANVVSWLVNIAADLGAAINSALGTGGEQTGPGGEGLGGFHVDIPSVMADVAQIIANIAGAVATFITDLTAQIVAATQSVSIPSVTATVAVVAWNVASAVAASLTQLGANIAAALAGAVITVAQGPTVTVTTIPMTPPSDDGTFYAAVDQWGADVKDGVAERIDQALNGDPGGSYIQLLDAVRLFTLNINKNLNPAFLEAQKVVETGGQNLIKGFDPMITALAGVTQKVLTPLGAIALGLGGFVVAAGAGLVGVEKTFADLAAALRRGTDEVGSAVDRLKALFEGRAEGDPFSFVDSMVTTAADIKSGGEDLSTATHELGVQIQEDFDTISTTFHGMENPFDALMDKLEDWNFELMAKMETIGGGTPAGLGGTVGQGGGIAERLGQQVEDMIAGIGPAVEAAIPDTNPLQPLIEKMQEWWTDVTSWDVGGLRPQDVSAAPGEEMDPAAMGEQMGTNMAKTFSSPEFIAGVKSGLEDVPVEQFAGVGAAFIAKVSEGIGAALDTSAAAATGAQEGSPTAGSTGAIVGNLQAIFTGMVQPLVAAAGALDAAIFAPVGAALMTKIQEGLSSALAAPEQGGGGTGAVGITPPPSDNMVSGLITQIAESLSAAVAAASPESFAAVGVALQAKIQEGLAAAMSAGGGGGGGRGQGALGNLGGGGTLGQTIIDKIIADLNSAIAAANFAGVGTTFGTALQTALTTALTTVQTSVMTTLTAMLTAIVASLDNGTVMVAAAAGRMGAAAQEISTQLAIVSTAAQTAVSEMVTGVVTSIDNGTTLVGAAAGRMGAAAMTVVDGLNAAAAAAGAAAASIGQAIVGALDAAVPQVAAAAGRLGAAAVVPINTAIQPGSPSRVVMPWAESIGEALVTALDRATPEVIASAAEMATGLVESLKTHLEEIKSLVSTVLSDATDGGVTSLEEAAPVLTEAAGTAIDTIADGVAASDLCTPIKEKVASVADCASSALEEVTPEISDSMGTAMETAADGATDTATAAGTSLGEAAGEGAVESTTQQGQEAGASFGNEMVAAMKSKMGDAAAAGEGIGQTAIQAILSAVDSSGGALQDAGRTAGEVMADGASEALDNGITQGMNNAVSKAQEMADRIRADVEERVANMRAVQDSWMTRGQDIASQRNAGAQERRDGNNRPIDIRITSVLDGKVLDDRIVQVALQPMTEAFQRVGTRPRRGKP